MEGGAGLRNVLVHIDPGVDHERIRKFLEHDLDRLEAFCAAVARAATSPREGARSGPPWYPLGSPSPVETAGQEGPTR